MTAADLLARVQARPHIGAAPRPETADAVLELLMKKTGRACTDEVTPDPVTHPALSWAR